jgi:hypothetical protein
VVAVYAINCRRANWAGIVPFGDLGGNRAGCWQDSRPDVDLIGSRS